MITMDALRAFIEAKVGAPLEKSALVFDAGSELLRHTGEVAGVPVQNTATMDGRTAATLLRSVFPEIPAAFEYASAGIIWNERKATVTIYANGKRTTYRRSF